MDKELLALYKEQNPVKYAQKFGHLEEENQEKPAAEVEVVVEKKKRKKILW